MAAAINQPTSYISNMLYSSLISRVGYRSYDAAEAGPSNPIGRRLASPLRPVESHAWFSEVEDDDGSDEDDDEDDDEYLYRGRSAYQRPVPFALPTNPAPANRTRTILPDAAVKSPHATFEPIDIPPSPLQLPTTTGPLFPDRPTDSLISVRTLSVDSISDTPRRRSASPIRRPAAQDVVVAPSVFGRSSSVASDSSASGLSTDWDGFSDDDDDDDDGLSSPPLFDCDESIIIRRGSDEVDYLNTLHFARKPSLTSNLPKSPPPTYSFSLPSSLQPESRELSYLSSSARSRSFRMVSSTAWVA